MVHDLYILMITAGVVSLLFKFLKQPVVLGYIVAGVLIGPYLFGETLVDAVDLEIVPQQCQEIRQGNQDHRFAFAGREPVQ